MSVNFEKASNILNVKINTERKSVILKKIEEILADGKQHYLVTPNPEIVMRSAIDLDYLKILNQADLKLPDGIGLKFASYLTKNKINQIIKGVDFIVDLCKLAEQKNYSVFFLGGGIKSARRTSEVLQSQFPNLIIKGTASGGDVSKEGILQDENILNIISKASPDILFVAFGFPKQEKFIAKYLSKFPSIKLAMGVGGAFDFFSGKIKRAPKLLRIFGLEWMWRLIMEPRRFKRIYTAVVKFPLCFLFWKIKKIYYD